MKIVFAVLMVGGLIASSTAYARYCTTNCYYVGNQRVCNTYCN